MADVSFVPYFEDIAMSRKKGTSRTVTLHDGSKIVLHKLDSLASSDPCYEPRGVAPRGARDLGARGEAATGLLYVDLREEGLLLDAEPGRGAAGVSAALGDTSAGQRPLLDELMDKQR